jgi:ABC-type antimicrobial peptide transport system permease subunit
MILRESTFVAAAGVLSGLGAALALARLVTSMLYGIEAHDPLTLAGAALLLLGVALCASWIPAQRAASVQPIDALRHE